MGNSLPCCLRSLLTMAAPSRAVLGAAISTYNLPDKTLTFLPFCQMFGPAAAAVVPLIPGDMDKSCCQSRAIQKSLRGHWSSSERSLEGDSPLHRPLPTNHPHQSMNVLCESACVKLSFFLFTAYYLNITHLIQMSHLILCQQLFYICSSWKQTPLSPFFLHYYTVWNGWTCSSLPSICYQWPGGVMTLPSSWWLVVNL